MLTLDQITYNIHNAISGGRTTHNEYVTPRQIAQWVKYHRALFIRRDLARNRRYREVEQDLQQIPISAVGDSVTLARSGKLPALLRLKDHESVTFVGFSSDGEPIQVIDNHAAHWMGNSRFTSEVPYAYIKNDYLYILNFAGADSVHLRGIFEDPEAVIEFLAIEGSIDEDDPWEYPIPMDMLEEVTKQILANEARALKSSPNDLRTDTIPDEQVQPAGS
jgi:hypothetical protein